MPDFSQVLKQPAGVHKKPPVLPIGNYQGIVQKYEVGESSKKKTPLVRFYLGLTGWPENIPDSEKTYEGPDGAQVPIDLGKKQQRTEFYITPDALYRLDEFIRSCGIEPKGKDYDTLVPELVGARVLIDLDQQMGEKDPYNTVRAVTGAA